MHRLRPSDFQWNKTIVSAGDKPARRTKFVAWRAFHWLGHHSYHRATRDAFPLHSQNYQQAGRTRRVLRSKQSKLLILQSINQYDQ